MVAPELRLASSTLQLNRSLLMGIVNASVNSFSDGGQYATLESQLQLADSLIEEGADIIDVGGQSLAGRDPERTPEEEIALVIPIISSIAARHPSVPISIDSYKPAVVDAAIRAGAQIVNDVSGLRYPEIASICAASQCALVIAHMKRPPKQYVDGPMQYEDVVADISAFWSDKLQLAADLGVPRAAIILDPGPDFTKTPAQTMEVMRRLAELRSFDRPLLLPLSRKDFLGAITGRAPRERDAATLAAIALTAITPGNIYRVHHVGAATDVLKVVDVFTGRAEIPKDFVLPDNLRWEPPGPAS